jgi:hypothetical protein
MNASIASLGNLVLTWLADYYLVATFLLLATLIGWRWVRHPAHRILIAWTVMLELAVLAVVCALPFWPRVSLIASAVESEPSHEEPATANMPLPFSPVARIDSRIGDRSVSEEPSTSEAAPEAASPAVATSQWRWSEVTAVGFLAGVAAVGLWLCWGAIATTFLCWKASPASESLRGELAEIVKGTEVVVAESLGQRSPSSRQPPPSPLRRRVPRLLVSARVANAVALGVLRPTIVLPAAMVQSGSPQTLRAVLLHEWAHIRHRDLWLLALGRCLLAVLFAHPLFWWLRRTIRTDQELLADAAAAGENRHDYAQELIRLVRITGNGPRRTISAAVGIWEGPSSFSRRITMLLDETFRVHTVGSRRWRYRALGVLVLLGVAVSLVTVQPSRSIGQQTQATSLAETTSPETVPIVAETKQGNSTQSARRNPPPRPADKAVASKPAATDKPVATSNWTPEAKEKALAMLRSQQIFYTVYQPQQREQIGVTTEQLAKLQPIFREYDKLVEKAQQDRGKIKAVLTSEQQTRLRQEIWGADGPATTCSSTSVSVKGERQWVVIPGSFPFPDLSDATAQKSLGFTENQQKQVRAILGDCRNAGDLLAREALRFSPQERNRQQVYFARGNESVANTPPDKDKSKEAQSLAKIRAGRLAWRAERDQQPLVKKSVELRQKLEAVLTPTQAAKYKNMAFENVAEQAVIDPLMLEKIGATYEQKMAVGRLFSEPLTKIVEFVEDASKKILDILDPQQRDVLLERVEQYQKVIEAEAARMIEAAADRPTAQMPASASPQPRIGKNADTPSKMAASNAEPGPAGDRAARPKRSRSISGRVLYHDGTPAANASVFLVGSSTSAGIGQGKAWQGERSDVKEDKTVAKAIADAEGQFTLSGQGDVKSIAISAPRLDFWVAPVPDWVPVRDGEQIERPEFTIKLPEAGRLVVKYDIPGGAAKAELFMQFDTWDSPLYRGVGYTPGASVANKGQVVLDNLPPGKFYLDRPKTIAYCTQFCDRRLITVESGKTVESNFIRDRGAAVVGQVVGLKKEMCASVSAAPNTAGAFISVRSPEAKGGIVGDMKLPLFDILKCGLDGHFKTEQLLPGKYAIIVETWLPEKPAEMRSSGIRRSSFIGRTIVTVPESGQPPQVTVELKPRENPSSVKPSKAAAVTIVELPRPNSGTFSEEQAEARKSEILSNRPTPPVEKWKNPYTGFCVHIHKDDSITIYNQAEKSWDGNKKPAKRISVAEIREVANGAPQWGNPVGILITSDIPLKDSKVIHRILDAIFVPSVQLFYARSGESGDAAKGSRPVQ